MAATKKDPVLRVTGLAASQPDEELTASLKAAISDDLTNEEKAKIDFRVAVVPSCYNNEEKVALVECRGGLPAFLSALTADPLGEWQMEMGDTDINFDQHFFGFTQLYTPASDTPVVADVIAITGLDGHAYGSWRGKGSLGRMWLRDFLCKDLPCCRTMIYGYNSKLSSHGVDTIMDYGRGLLEELKKVRGTEECLVKAAQITEDHPTIAALHRATYSMLLFGIPHRGLVVDDIQKMLAGEDRHPRRGLLEQIREKSDLLASQLDNFRNLIQDRKVVSFYETGQTRQLQFDRESKRWTRTGDFITAVDSNSALLQLPDAMEEKIPLDADHSMMVKFDNKNALGYSSARDKLRQFAQDAPGVVADRFARAQNRLKPCNMVPFPPDSAFVGREDVLAKLKKIHSGSALPSHSRAALVGLGGVGKSQIAIEYAYRVKEAAPHMWVFWVHASNAARFKQAYQEIAARIELPGRDDPKTNIFRLVHNWLCDERNGRWLMIVDNADDDRVFASPSATGDLSSAAQGLEPTWEAAAALASFLPQAANGWILVTSRDRIAAVNLVEARHKVIQVEPMGEQEALTLLKSKTRVDESSEGDARALVKTLEGIPLAVTHAAAYITANEPMVDIAAYLELFRESEENQAHLLNDKARDIRRDASVSSAVITTWQLSFEQIRKTKPEAADLLSLMTMFDRQGVPEHILYEGRSKLQFTEAVGPLLRFSLVRAQAREQSEGRLQGQLFEMHNLVQLATKKWLELREQVNVWQRAALRIMAAAFPSGQHETWAACQTLLPHSTKVLDYSTDKNDKAKLDRATIATNTAWYLMSMGQYAEAERHGRSAVAAREEVLGREHRDTLTSVSQLGSVLSRQGKYEEAEAKHRRALEGYEKVLGPEHPNTLTSVSNLGSVLSRQGKYEEAEAKHRRALEGGEKVLGLEHPNTLTSVSNLGSVLSRQGKYEEAEAMHRRDLEGSEKVLGPEHPDTLTSVSNLGSVLESQGKYEEAEAKHRRALEGREKVLGPEHPDTLTSVSNLGSVLSRQGKYEEAEAMHRRDLEGSEKVLGPEHPDTLTSVSNLGSVLESQGKYEEAEAKHRRALEGREKVLGPEHPNTLTSVSNLGSVLSRQGKYEEAEAMHRRDLEGSEKVLGPEHPDTLTSVSNLGSVLESQGKYEEAEAKHRRALEGREKVLGPEHPDTLTSVSNLGSVLSRQGKYEEAEAKHRRALEGYEKVLGPEHPDTLTSVSQLGSVLSRQGKYEEAEAKHRRALEGYEKVLGPEHPNTLTSVSNLGSVLSRQGKYEEAEAKHRRALEGGEKVLGLEHPNTLTSVSNLGSVLSRQGKYEEAEAMHRRDLEGSEKVLGPEHPDTLTSVSNLGSVLWSQGQFADAETLETRVMEARKRVLGDGHPDTLTAMANLAFTLRSQGRCQEALSLMEGCVQVRGRVLGLGHPDTEFSSATLNQWRLESLDLGA
ncbi:TPR-like protein [Lizonia empirigonia]|nr:TPR-like protein [Lizonia empirigonia]